MACHLHEEINFRSNMTQEAAESCAKKCKKNHTKTVWQPTYLNEDSANGL